MNGWLERRFGPMGLSRVPLTDVPGEARSLFDAWEVDGAGKGEWPPARIAEFVRGLGYRVEDNYIYPKEPG